MSYLQELQKATNKTRTENNAVTHKSSLNPVLDFFALGAAKRKDIPAAVELFKRAYAHNQLLALKTLFYIRDVRGGQGERDIFRACIKEVPEEVVQKNLKLIPEYGRWDDLLVLEDELIIPLIAEQLGTDEALMQKGESISLLAKWLPSENTSSPDTKKRARKLIQSLGMKPSQYRKKLSSLRKHIDILEQRMSRNMWETIVYEKLPSQAHRKHVKAFNRNDSDRYEAYLESVKKGDASINTKTLFPYEVFDMVALGDVATANMMWKNLPDYTNGKNALVVADVSGSMMGRPMSISVSLALYFAERNQGAFKDHFITFSSTPSIQSIVGNTLREKLIYIESADWGMSTNIDAVFDLLLTAGVASKEMPEIIYIISDMEFNLCTNVELSNFERAEEKFKAHDMVLPHIVFWNVDSRDNHLPATKFDHHVTLISGASPSVFKYAVEGKSAEQSMIEILESSRYAPIVL